MITITYEATGYRDVLWCWFLNEPVVIQYRKEQPYCIACNSDPSETPEEHTFICHINKPRNGVVIK